jgi:hypothetical protein
MCRQSPMPTEQSLISARLALNRAYLDPLPLLSRASPSLYAPAEKSQAVFPTGVDSPTMEIAHRTRRLAARHSGGPSSMPTFGYDDIDETPASRFGLREETSLQSRSKEASCSWVTAVPGCLTDGAAALLVLLLCLVLVFCCLPCVFGFRAAGDADFCGLF